jgi:hypothetical protein
VSVGVVSVQLSRPREYWVSRVRIVYSILDKIVHEADYSVRQARLSSFDEDLGLENYQFGTAVSILSVG